MIIADAVFVLVIIYVMRKRIQFWVKAVDTLQLGCDPEASGGIDGQLIERIAGDGFRVSAFVDVAGKSACLSVEFI